MRGFTTKKMTVEDSWVHIRHFKLNTDNRFLREKYEEKFNIVTSDEVKVTLDRNQPQAAAGGGKGRP
jgi:hypothetical protein